MYIKRQVEAEIKKNLFKGDGLIIYGARQVGKTTLVKKILEDYRHLSTKYINCDEGDIRTLFARADTSTELKRMIGDAQLVVIDEAQRVLNIGLKLKLLIDTYPHQQIIATGSSSFDLSNEIKESLTGRSREFWLYPLSTVELFPEGDTIDFMRNLESLLVYGSYPKVYEAVSFEEKKIQIEKIASHYLYKDVLKFQTLKNAELVRKLLEALALQVGSEVSYNELSTMLGVSRQTVENYVNILENAFVLYKVTPFSRNLRKEIGKLRKIYFYDLGVRNVLIDSLKPISLRNDVGALWENFVITEFKKRSNFIGNMQKIHYWRTYDGQEIDLVEEKEGRLYGYEIKWSKARRKAPKAWGSYKDASWRVITKDTFTSLQQSRPIA